MQITTRTRGFELSDAMVASATAGAAVSIGVDPPNYNHVIDPLDKDKREALLADLTVH